MNMLNSEYKNQEYWDKRYKLEDSFEWFKSYRELKNEITPLINTDDRILVLGCGNSPFSRDMYKEGFKHITNIDYSPVCIESMSNSNKDCEQMNWLTMDIRDLKFDNDIFDVIIEKGTLDAVLTDEKDVWHLSDGGYQFIEDSLTHVSRALKPGGRFLSITFAQPHFRKQLYTRTMYRWSVNITRLQSTECFEYFLYVMTKSEGLSENDQLLEKQALEKRRKRTGELPEPIPLFIEENCIDYLFNIDVSI